MTVNIPIFNAPKISNFMKVGAISGGRDTNPLNLISPKINPINVVIKMPMIIAPGIFLTDKIDIARNPTAASSVSIFEKLPRDRSVA